ncbi:NAD(P)-dependent oxidoreductase [Chitinophaga japonensis]|uniref:3-hydroxyisobutyrate dehydrogenase-like beta-hydroxyacid dehydrogenase n=1 Tax=Chitinophaga japonensis TaxID=104662 RepID=A0A562SST1_CHIJA|nr:NAD(P)-binding domain-containing protein [Chitinophaga japonensis]TWI84074.1 3-hydroxyisobutyrate dehydrogenase-like beta-hydroxyacid dehydrogenase [Chitinophaga japonensis]
MMKETTNNPGKVSVIGLGSMGAALARTFLQKGFQVTVWNRDIAKAQPLAEAGATPAGSAAAAIEASPVVVVCVSDYKATRAILEEHKAAAALQGRTLVQLSTGTPKEARDLEAWAQQQGAACMNGAILAWPGQIGGDDTTILAAGNTTIFQEQESLLRALAGNLTYMGTEAGAAAALFAAVLSYLAGSWIGFCHGALICEREGLRADDFGVLMEALSGILGAESRHMGEVIQHNRFRDPESTVKTTGEDLELLVQHAREAGISSELPKFAAGLFRRTIDAGYGAEEHAAVIKVLRN